MTVNHWGPLRASPKPSRDCTVRGCRRMQNAANHRESKCLVTLQIGTTVQVTNTHRTFCARRRLSVRFRSLPEGRMNPGPESAAHHNATMGCLREAGFSFRDAIHAYSMLDSYTYGFALQERTIRFETPQEAAEMARATVGDMGAQYPYLAEVVEEFAKDGYDYGKEFEFGLDVILNGLEPYLDP